MHHSGHRFSLALILAAVAASGAIVVGQQHTQQRQRQQHAWPPPVQKVNPMSPPLTAAQEMKTFFLPPGYHVELVAEDPLIQDPVAIDFDPDGRIYVLEMTGFAMDKTMQDSRDPIGRVVVLEDTNGDGKMDKRTIFFEGLVLPRALKVLDHGVMIGEPPNLWLVKDLDGDLKGDTKQLIRNDFGTLNGNLEHNANSLYWGLDNWMYTAEHDWYLRLTHGTFEVARTLNRGQWGVAMDDAGRMYRNTNTEALFVDEVPAHYYMRNPNLVRTRGAYERFLDPDKTEIWPVRPTPGTNRGYREELKRPDGTLAYYAGVSSPLIYRGDRLPSELQGDAFVVDSPTNLVHRFKIVDDGGRLTAHDAYQKGEFLASTDERFRPVNLSLAPDGTIYVVDMYRGVVQDVYFQTDYLKDYIAKHQLELPVHKGRIFRIVHDSTKKDKTPALSKETPAALVSYLSHPNAWWRETAQRLIVEREDKSVAPALTKLASDAPDARTRLHALWTLDGLDAIQPESVLQALNDKAPEVRASALRLSERWLNDATNGQKMRAAVLGKMDDANWFVRWQLAATLGELPPDGREQPLITMLQRYGEDPILVDAAISGLKGQEADVLSHLSDTAQSGQSGQKAVPADAVSMLAGAITKSGDRPAIQKIVAQATDTTRAEAERLALLHGIDSGLSASAFGGRFGLQPSGATGRVTMAAGGYAGMDTNRLFPQGQAPQLFDAEPKALTQLAAGSGEAAELAKKIVARVSWPGKPAPVVAPLTEAEQKRYAAGAELYKSICIACHQPDGRGKEHVAPALAGSKFATGNPAIPVRILLAGKEGTIGLMPPLNSLSDDQIASVLTFVRREWGNSASPVNPALVKETRALTASHTRPWTNDELTKLAGPGRPGG